MDVNSVSWFPFSDEPLLVPSGIVLKYSSPALIMPKSSADGKWHLFCSSFFGIHHFISDSGLRWHHVNLVVLGARDPFICYENGYYCLVYEKFFRNNPLDRRRNVCDGKNFSRIEIVFTKDFSVWSRPYLLLDSRKIPFATVHGGHPRISNPGLFHENGFYRLYFGASSQLMPDTRVRFPRFTGSAVSESLKNEFRLEYTDPILVPEPDSLYSNLAVGNVSFFRYESIYYAFGCSAYWDVEKNQSFSALTVKSSNDGINFTSLHENPILAPAERGWTEKYIRSCILGYISYEKCFYCYYSALDDHLNREPIGLLLGLQKHTSGVSSQYIGGDI